MTKDEIYSALVIVQAPARKRMDEASPMWLGLKPTEADWMTSEEMAESHRLKLLLPTFGEEKRDAIERIRLKREARKQLRTQ